LSLDPIWTLAANKLVAKVASRVVKPDGECLVESGDEQDFLSPLPVQLLPGLEPGDLPRLREYRLARFADVARWTLEQLSIVFGPRARQLRESVLGIDPSPVLPVGAHPPQVLLDHDFGRDTNDMPVVRAALSGLAETAGRALREQRLAAAHLGVALDYSDGVRTARQLSAPRPTANDFMLCELANRVLNLAWTRRVRLRHLRLACSGLCFPPAQLELFETDGNAQRRDRLVDALDQIRSRFGARAVYLGRGLSLGRP
jgi:DNA polymerase-4